MDNLESIRKYNNKYINTVSENVKIYNGKVIKNIGDYLLYYFHKTSHNKDIDDFKEDINYC